MRRALIILLAVLPGAGEAAGDCDLAGHWTGVWVRRGFALPVEFDFERADSGFAGTFGSRDFQAAGIPLSAVRPDAIGIFGHSQGGTIAPLVASRSPDVAFVIASAASGLSMSEAERFSLMNAAGVRRLSPADSTRATAYVDLVVRTEYGGGSWASLDSAASANQNETWYFPVPGAQDPFWSFSRSIAGYDPHACWSLVRVPVLLLFGERDERVATAASRESIEAALRAAHNSRVTTRVFPGADHSLRLASGQPGSPWPRSAPGYPEIVIDWLRKLTE